MGPYGLPGPPGPFGKRVRILLLSACHLRMSVCLSLFLFVGLSMYMSVCLFVCLSMYQM